MTNMYEEIKDSDVGKDLQDAYNHAELLQNGVSDMENETKKENSVRIFDQDGVSWVLDGAILEEMETAVNLDYSKSVLADSILADNSITRREYPKRLLCEYCGCISGKDHGTCEHCGAVLTEPKSEDLDEVMKRWW
jgi:hypothetical protein